MAPEVAIYDTIAIQNIIFFGKQGQTEQNRPIHDQTGSNSAKLEQTGPCNCFHMNLHMMGEKLKLNKEKMKQIYGTGLRFENHGYRVV